MKIWKSFAEYREATKMYDEFKTKVLSFFIGAGATHTFTIQEYNTIVGERSRLGIKNIQDYMAFYRKYRCCTSWDLGLRRYL